MLDIAEEKKSLIGYLSSFEEACKIIIHVKLGKKKIRERANKLRKFTWILDRRYNNKKIHILKALDDGKCAEWALKWALCILAAIREKILNLHWLQSKNKPFSQEKFIPEINASSRSITCAVKSCSVVNTMSS